MNTNLTTERPTFVTHLECSMTGERYEADTLHNLSKAGKPLLVRYDLVGVAATLTKHMLKQRPNDLWKWRELLPVRKAEDIVSLGEDATPRLTMSSAFRTGSSSRHFHRSFGRCFSMCLVSVAATPTRS